MNVVDSSGWLEYFAEGPNADFFAKAIEATLTLVTAETDKIDEAVRSNSRFDAAGPINGPAIVLVHGSVVTRKMWLPSLRGLSDAYLVIAADLPGHGALDKVPFSFAAAVRALTEIARATPAIWTNRKRSITPCVSSGNLSAGPRPPSMKRSD